MRKNKIVWIGLLALVVGVGLFLWWAAGPQPAAQSAPLQRREPIRVSCGTPNIPGWTVVDEYLVWSGCQDWECWSEWIRRDSSNALMEKAPRLPETKHGEADPSNPWPPYGYIYDARQSCADGEKAKGQWYHNAHARPYFRFIPAQGGEPSYLLCEWAVDQDYRHSWSFAENDQCPYCQLVPTATPPATVCWGTPIVHLTPNTPPSPTPWEFGPPTLAPIAWVRSSSIGSGAWYQTANNKPYFYWPFQMFLNVRLSAQVVAPGSGCASSSEITRYFFEGVTIGNEERTLCSIESDPPMPARTACRDPNGHCCRWRDIEDDPIHINWTLFPTPPMAAQPDTIHFWGVRPQPVTLRYTVEVVSTYCCQGGESSCTQLVWYMPLNLKVYLTVSVPRR